MTAINKLDLRGVACPLNFVKTKLLLDKLPVGALLEVILDDGEPVESVYSSIVAEGHSVEAPAPFEQGSFALVICKRDS
jgi:TusA-related sulfurtransferase